MLLEYNGKIYIGLDSPVGIPVVEVYNLLGRAHSALRSGIPCGIPLGTPSSSSLCTAFHWVSYKLKMWDCCWNTEKRRMASILEKV